jgi:hypothetical protein
VQHNSEESSVAQPCGARLGTRSQNPMIPLLLESYRLFSERLLTLFLMKLSFLGWQFLTKMFFRGRRNRRNSCLVPVDFRLFHRTENSRNSVPNHSTEEKTTRNSVPWNKNRRKHLEFCSEPFRGRENIGICGINRIRYASIFLRCRISRVRFASIFTSSVISRFVSLRYGK